MNGASCANASLTRGLKRVAVLLLALTALVVAVPQGAFATEWNVSSNDELVVTVTNAQSGDTINLAAGKYTLYKMGAQTKGKDLTFVGAGAGATEWGIGATIPDPSNFGTEYNGDYSFDGAGTITFKNMTLQSGSVDYLGFIRATNTVVDGCVVNGKTFYWGYTSAKFTNTTFNAPTGDYAVWTYSSPTMTFDGCTFNTTGKCINVYRDYAGAAYTINFSNNTINNSAEGTKQVLNINDSYPAGQSYTINISGTNTVNGTATPACSIACSRLFGFGGKSGNNAGNTTVNIDGTTVFTGGKQVSHAMPSQHYTAGNEENAFTTTYGDWQSRFGMYEVRTATKTCNYCGYSESWNEYRTSTQSLPADILVCGDINNGGNTEHDEVVKAEQGSTVDLTGALEVSSIYSQMKQLELLFSGTGDTLSVDEYGFTSVLTLPAGLTLPSGLTADQVVAKGLADTFAVNEVKVEGQTVSVSFKLSDSAKASIDSYTDLEAAVKAAVDANGGWISVTVPGVTVGGTAGEQLTVTGTVSGTFAGTAVQNGTTKKFTFDWAGTQWADGKDAVATDDATIQLTIEVTQHHTVTFVYNNGETNSTAQVAHGEAVDQPSDPTKDGYTFTGWYTDEACTTKYSFSTPVTGDITLYAGWKKKESSVKPDDKKPSKTDDSKKSNNGGTSKTTAAKAQAKSSTAAKSALPKTGDDSMLMVAVAVAAGVAALLAGTFVRKYTKRR